MNNQLAFHGTQFNVTNHSGKIWLRGTEIAQALGMSKSDGVSQIYHRNADEFTDAMTLTLNLSVNGINNSARSKKFRLFSLRGAHLIAMFARTPIAKEFRRWVLDILDREVNKSTSKSSTTVDERTPLRDAVNLLVSKRALPYDEAYSIIHQRFGVQSIEQLEPELLPMAIEYVHRLALEGELMPKEPQPATPAMPIFPIGINFQYVVTVESGCVIEMRPLRQGEMVASAEDMIWMLRKTGWVVELAEDMDAMNSTALAQLIQRSAAMRIQAF